jgi:hypothetical protein
MTIPCPEEVRFVVAELCQEILATAVDRRDTLRARARAAFPTLAPAEQLEVVDQIQRGIEHMAGLVLSRRLTMEETGRVRRPDPAGRNSPRADQ